MHRFSKFVDECIQWKCFTEDPEPDYLEAAIQTVLTIHQEESEGDVLLFLTDEDEIERACQEINLRASDVMPSYASVDRVTCIPLYPSLTPPQLQKKFDHVPTRRSRDSRSRKVVISTNIAETSLAIYNIVYVVDPGLSARTTYNPRIRVQTHLVCPISKASAQQRAGCAGQKRPGKCFRLYTEDDFKFEFEDRTPPKIVECNLATTVLRLAKLGVKDLVQFNYDPPPPESLMRAIELLNNLGALDNDGNLTPLGAMMAEFPLDPQLSKALIVSPTFSCSNEVLTVVAMLSVSDVWVRPPRQLKEAKEAKARLTIPNGDHLTMLNAYNMYHQNKEDKNWAWQHCLSARALAQAENIRAHLKRLMDRFEIELLSSQDMRTFYDNVRKALCCGFFMQVAHREGNSNNYVTVKDNQVVGLHPSCSLNNQPEWVLFDEFILTTRPYIRTVTDVRPEWLLEYAPAYFDLSTFTDGETKQALQRVIIKRAGKSVIQTGSKVGRREKKKRRKN
ncbi:pre-mRNA-splicing factor ATP-dependent RNA helicase DHX15/PRP43 [Sistotremastrum suecicum HHB10207 ss-3]|uniref:RNA helicase n=1 Tax=Sistotremastrum suecicum HHB10207 ss-3 TaxID=1314776 RepID=A0A166DLT1_9AGAM|nr:pre-mRNA-splicing factor ATP-dependent RNA helicase DHX15/PRP43 [Sistotremastrum suecicum HHB10207 ss-3]